MRQRKSKEKLRQRVRALYAEALKLRRQAVDAKGQERARAKYREADTLARELEGA
jgi:hypothetical protein